MEWWQVYLITRLGAIQTFIGVVGSLFAFSGFLTLTLAYLQCIDATKEEIVTTKKWGKITTIISLILMSIAIMIPTTEQAIAIYVIPKLSNNEQLQDISEKGLDLIETQFDKWIDNLNETTNKE